MIRPVQCTLLPQKHLATYSNTSSPSACYHVIKDTIIHEFQSKVLKEEWEKHQKHLIIQGSKLRSESHRVMEDIDKQMNEFRIRDSLQQQQLDERAEDLQAKFADINTELQFDANRIDRKLASMIFKGETEPPCLGSRTKVALCFQDAKGSSCDDYLKELERCVKETVVFKKQ